MKQLTKIISSSLGWLFGLVLVAHSVETFQYDTSIPRIVGGYNDDIANNPWLVSLAGTGQIGHFCGGSIISPSWVLTAAHCMVATRAEKLIARAGSTYHNSGGEVRQVSRVIVNPNYNVESKMDYDFALLKLKKPFNFGKKIAAAPLADYSQPFHEKDMCRASGWGVLKESGHESPRNLQSVDVPLVDQTVCERQYRPKFKITERMVCAGTKGKDSCQGDSGGPLICKGVLLGVVSFGIGCGSDRYSGVYANVPEARNWIWGHAKV